MAISDAGASRRATEQRRTPRTKEDKIQSKEVKWNVLKPIMALCNDEYKNLCKGPDKGLRTKIQCNR